MIEVALSRADGTALATFPFPTEAKEVSYKQYVRFEDAYQAKDKWMKEQEGKSVTDPAFVAGYIRHVARIVQAFTGVDDVLEAALGDYIEHARQFFGEDAKGFSEELDKVEQTVFTLYANIWRTVGSYQKHAHTDGAYHFAYKGKAYCLKSAYRDAITHQVRFESLSVAQGIEAMEALRIYEMAKGNDPGNKFLFTTIITLIACLALEEGQAFPDNEKEIQRWISERVVHFQDVDMETALNVRDFFLNTAGASKITHAINGSFARPSPSKKATPGKNTRQQTRRRRRG